jgi:hypothetical protein
MADLTVQGPDLQAVVQGLHERCMSGTSDLNRAGGAPGGGGKAKAELIQKARIEAMSSI